MTIYGKNDIRCSVCLREFNTAQLKSEGLFNGTCPICGTGIKPHKMAEDGYVKVNWQELRVLAIYARRWADTFDRRPLGNLQAITVLENILKRLERYKPPGADPLDGTPKVNPKELPLPSPYFKKLNPPRDTL